MSNLSLFLKKNKKVKENVKYAATKSLVDEKGNPLEWEFRAISTRENDDIRDSCTLEIPITGKTGMYRTKINYAKYNAKVIAAAVVYPDLYSKELQDDYGVTTPEDLIREMVDDLGEYNDLLAFVQKHNGFSTGLEGDVEEAKN